MPVPISLMSRRVYHFTHIDNLKSMLEKGILARNHPAFPADRCRSVADAGLQRRRSLVSVPCGPGGRVHNYVPLYFGSRSPMLFSIVSGQGVNQADLVYFEFPITLAERSDVIFTRASAHTIGDDGFFHAPAALQELDWAAIDLQDPETPANPVRHRRMAEMLVHWRLAVRDAVACIAANEDAVRKVEDIMGPDRSVPVGLESPERIHWF